MNQLTLKQRAIALLFNGILFYLAFLFVQLSWYPTGGLESVWFLSAIGLWFCSLISSPYFTPPKDGLVNGLSALLVLLTIDLTPAATLQTELNVIRWLAAAYALIVIGASLGGVILYEKDGSSPISRLCYKLVDVLGRGELLYTPPALISIVGIYSASPAIMACLTLLWTFFILARPVELFIRLWTKWAIWQVDSEKSPLVGIIERVDDPNIVRVRLNKTSSWRPGVLHVAVLSDDEQHYVFALSKQVRGTEVVGTGICIGTVGEDKKVVAGSGIVLQASDNTVLQSLLQKISNQEEAKLVGFVVENSTIGMLKFELSSHLSVREGSIIFALVGDTPVYYQVIDGETSEETFENNPHGRQIVKAAQIGSYDNKKGFIKYPWLPAMNTPLFSGENIEFPQTTRSEREFAVGKLPFTNLEVIANIDDLVEYHTAILGVTGTGKTELSLSIIREALARGVMVFCVDFTGEYKARLASSNPDFPKLTPEQNADLNAKLFAVETGTYGAPNEKAALNQTLKTLRQGITQQVKAFLESTDKNLAIFELSEIANTKATLRVTEMYLSIIMGWAKEHRKAKQVLLVLEEAHTIIPEAYGSGIDAETKWVVDRIGQIALQGRKYGVGLLVISQRTALVSKTILSQCNTFLTHSLIDETSLNFLKNVYSPQHVSLIPNLRFREFLAFGKALRVERPILLERAFDNKLKEAVDALKIPLIKIESS